MIDPGLGEPVTTFRFGVSRNHGGMQLLDGARRLADALSLSLAAPVKLTVAFDYVHLLRNFLSGAIDVAWMPPLMHAQAAAQGGVLAAVCMRRGRLTYRSMLVVREDSPWRRAADLKGARAAWVDRGSASGYIFPRLHLLRAGVDPQRDLAEEQLLGSPVSACAAVAQGRADVCACFASDDSDRAAVLADFHATVGASAKTLRILEMTDPIPPDGIAVGGHLPQDDQARIRVALLTLHESAAGLAALRMLLQADRLVAPTDEVQRALRGLIAAPPSAV